MDSNETGLITSPAQDMYRISMGYVSFPHLITMAELPQPYVAIMCPCCQYGEEQSLIAQC
eukprot:scaffold10112_cov228-Skeletonema_marinoi.AAC.1